MGLESSIHQGSGHFAIAWSRLTSLPEKFKAKVVESAKNTKKLAQEDPRTMVHSLKAGLALTLVSLFYYLRPLYDGVGVSAMWAIPTVVVLFEFTVGATVAKVINRGVATILACALGIGVYYITNFSGKKGEPILLGFFVFILSTASSFSRFFPRIKARYDYGVLIFMLTFVSVSLSGYRVDKILELAYHRLSTFVIGSATCVIVSILICPVWAGEDLHNLVSLNLENLGSFLEGFGSEFFNIEQDGDTVISKDDKSFLQGCISVLDSITVEEAMANYATWEPAHGAFRFRHPWKQYLKIGNLSRECAYHVEALKGYVNTRIQAPPEFHRIIQEACINMSLESGKALAALSLSIRTMTLSSSADFHVLKSKAAASKLKTTLKTALLENIDILEVIQATTITSILIETVTCIEEIVKSVQELARLAHFKTEDSTAMPNNAELLHQGSIKHLSNSNGNIPVLIQVHGPTPTLVEVGNTQAFA